ncbi:MAG: LysM peptidoglycan-binding domain-containing protein [Bacteroidetes bacterium]|nr:LysM peptidoglycan-binding domain-containing protein [Bacteroidota bacterium]
MFRILSAAFLCLCFFSASAQDDDSLFVSIKSKSWVLPYTTGNNETVFAVARRFHVPPAVLASINNVDAKGSFPSHSHITVPIAAYNFLREKGYDMTDALPLYYVVTENDDLQRISHLSGVSQQVMERWNRLPDNNIYIGSHMFIGWILYDATSGTRGVITSYDDDRRASPQAKTNRSLAESTNRKPNPELEWSAAEQRQDSRAHVQMAPEEKQNSNESKPWHDTVIVIKKKQDTTLNPFEQLYLTQTGNGVNATVEKGSVAFFNSAGTAQHVYYAMHNELERGVILKVYNPGDNKTVYAKVIGPLPATKQYYNCIMALSSNAKEELGLKEDKAWCEVSHR